MSTTKSTKNDGRDRLCHICCDINFDRYLSGEIKDPIPLGCWSRIRGSRKCPFCRLVVDALAAESRRTPKSSRDEVVLRNELSWKLGIELSPYDRSKSESYSNKYDLRSKAKQCSRTIYRLLVSSEATNGQEANKPGMIQYLAHKERCRDDRQFFGRKVDTKRVDLGVIENWLDTCSGWHKGACDRDIRTAANLPLNLRLIDAKRRCIIKVSRGEVPDYVALSYMWGSHIMREETGMEPALLLRKDIRFDAQGEEVTPLKERLPKTIEDAVTLTQALGYRYLWNDALCIVQDNPAEEKVPDLTNMKTVYSSSSLTIAAAAGTHADYGIPGIGVPRKSQQRSELVNGLRLATMFPSFTDLENSSDLRWNTRGWTFQEKLLSRRLLLFTDYQVYFKCSESIWTEEIHLESERLSKSVEARQAKYLWNPGYKRKFQEDHDVGLLTTLNRQLRRTDHWSYLGGFLEYASAIEEYSKRQLTDPNDILFAVSGILETLEVKTETFILGLPRKHILEALLWYPEPGCEHVQRLDSGLPSWTWAGWSQRNGTCCCSVEIYLAANNWTRSSSSVQCLSYAEYQSRCTKLQSHGCSPTPSFDNHFGRACYCLH
jgi:hypothetical protein